MSKLPFPIKKVLREPADEVAIQRMWRNIAHREADDRGSRGASRAAWIAAAAAICACIVALWPAAKREEPQPIAVSRTLRLTSGDEPRVLAADREPAAFTFEDGSEVKLMPGASLAALENAPPAIVFLLHNGRIEVNVAPQGPRKWSIESGLATIEVIGARASIERDETHLQVAVAEGVVLVRGERVPERVQRLTAGDALELRTDAAVEESALSKRIGRSLAAKPKQQQPREKVLKIPSEPERPESPRSLTASELLVRADEARLKGDHAGAAALLETLLRDHASDPSAAIAAFTLGRIYFERLDRPRDAARTFERAIALELPVALREDALANLADAHDRAGDRARARETAARYLGEYPAGRRADAMMLIRDKR